MANQKPPSIFSGQWFKNSIYSHMYLHTFEAIYFLLLVFHILTLKFAEVTSVRIQEAIYYVNPSLLETA